MSKTSLVSLDAKSQKALEVLKNAHRPLNISEIARKMGIKNFEVCKNALFNLLADNKVVAERVGYYWLFSLPNQNEGEDDELFITGIGWVKKSKLRKLVNPSFK